MLVKTSPEKLWDILQYPENLAEKTYYSTISGLQPMGITIFNNGNETIRIQVGIIPDNKNSVPILPGTGYSDLWNVNDIYLYSENSNNDSVALILNKEV